MSKTKNNNELLLDLRGELYNIKNIVNDINKRNKLLQIELINCKNEIRTLNARMPERRIGWFRDYWEIKGADEQMYENINKS
jgi:hypothetical protein